MIPRLTCPNCQRTALQAKTIYSFVGPVKLGAGFIAIWDQWMAMPILGFDEKGALRVDPDHYHTGGEKNERIQCDRCSHEFNVPPGVEMF